MKGLILLFFVLSIPSFAQDKLRGTIKVRKSGCVVSATDKFIYTKVDSMPDFPGGGKIGDDWMRKNMVYPESALSQGITGKVVVSFVVMPDGSLTNTKILSSTNKIFNDECMRLITAMPKWKPGKCSGKVVAVEYTLPMRFHFPGATWVEK